MTENVFSEIRESLLLNAKSVQYNKNIKNAIAYMRKWLSILEKSYNDFGIIQENYKLPSLPKEKFVYKHNLERGILNFTFDIDGLVSEANKIKKSRFSIESFQDARWGSEFMFTYCENISEPLSIKRAPIIAVPFFIVRDVDFLVVDGNHRISVAKRNKDEFIDVYIVDFETSSKYLFGDFEKKLYILTNECNFFFNEYVNGIIPMEQSVLNLFEYD